MNSYISSESRLAEASALALGWVLSVVQREKTFTKFLSGSAPHGGGLLTGLEASTFNRYLRLWLFSNGGRTLAHLKMELQGTA